MPIVLLRMEYTTILLIYCIRYVLIDCKSFVGPLQLMPTLTVTFNVRVSNWLTLKDVGVVEWKTVNGHTLRWLDQTQENFRLGLYSKPRPTKNLLQGPPFLLFRRFHSWSPFFSPFPTKKGGVPMVTSSTPSQNDLWEVFWHPKRSLDREDFCPPGL